MGFWSFRKRKWVNVGSWPQHVMGAFMVSLILHLQRRDVVLLWKSRRINSGSWRCAKWLTRSTSHCWLYVVECLALIGSWCEVTGAIYITLLAVCDRVSCSHWKLVWNDWRDLRHTVGFMWSSVLLSLEVGVKWLARSTSHRWLPVVECLALIGSWCEVTGAIYFLRRETLFAACGRVFCSYWKLTWNDWRDLRYTVGLLWSSVLLSLEVGVKWLARSTSHCWLPVVECLALIGSWREVTGAIYVILLAVCDRVSCSHWKLVWNDWRDLRHTVGFLWSSVLLSLEVGVKWPARSTSHCWLSVIECLALIGSWCEMTGAIYVTLLASCGRVSCSHWKLAWSDWRDLHHTVGCLWSSVLLSLEVGVKWLARSTSHCWLPVVECLALIGSWREVTGAIYVILLAVCGRVSCSHWKLVWSDRRDLHHTVGCLWSSVLLSLEVGVKWLARSTSHCWLSVVECLALIGSWREVTGAIYVTLLASCGRVSCSHWKLAWSDWRDLRHTVGFLWSSVLLSLEVGVRVILRHVGYSKLEQEPVLILQDKGMDDEYYCVTSVFSATLNIATGNRTAKCVCCLFPRCYLDYLVWWVGDRVILGIRVRVDSRVVFRGSSRLRG